MLLDAFAAERLRLARARGLLFWGFLFVPIVSLAFGLMGTLITVATRRAPTDPGLAFAANDLAKAASEAMTQTDLIPVQLFFMLAAAGLVADDYRWETWRLVTPRNTRTNLLLAKLMTFGLGAAGSILLIAVLSMVGALIDGLVTGDGFTSNFTFAADLVRMGGSFATSWLELMAMASLAMLITVLTRNAVPAVIGSIGLWLAQMLIIDRVTRDLTGPPGLVDYAFLPAFSADVLRTALLAGAPPESQPAAWPLAFLALALWAAGLAALAVWAFRRQDLTRE
jgi:ABC-2 type transport system permease protein